MAKHKATAPIAHQNPASNHTATKAITPIIVIIPDFVPNNQRVNERPSFLYLRDNSSEMDTSGSFFEGFCSLFSEIDGFTFCC